MTIKENLIKFSDVAILIDPDKDNVAVALKEIPSSTLLHGDGGNVLKIIKPVKKAQRFAISEISSGNYLFQYGHPFGRSKGIRKGELLEPENVENKILDVDIDSFKEPFPTVYDKNILEITFSGYKRKNGSVGTRNYYLVVPTSMCVSETALKIAQSLDCDRTLYSRYNNIDGIVAIPNTEGCGCASTGQIDRFLTVLKGYITHPNVGGCMIMDLGCEQTNYEVVSKYLEGHNEDKKVMVDWITVQSSGGTRLSIEKAKKIIIERLKDVNNVERTPESISNIVLGTECGASDSFSGITANSVIGSVADMIVSGEGKVILSEVPEMVGTFGVLFSRFRNKDVALKFKDMQNWYERLARKLGLTLDDNLVKKNIEGGLINNYLKSLGAIIKGGTTVIEDVLEYGETVSEAGLSVMQGPGGDLESVTGIVASGANIVCFSTGYGATSGNAICPVIKISSNSETYNKLPEDIDFNAGRLLSEQIDVSNLGEELLGKVIAVASGEKTWSERWKQRQFQVWTAGKLPL